MARRRPRSRSRPAPPPAPAASTPSRAPLGGERGAARRVGDIRRAAPLRSPHTARGAFAAASHGARRLCGRLTRGGVPSWPSHTARGAFMAVSHGAGCLHGRLTRRGVPSWPSHTGREPFRQARGGPPASRRGGTQRPAARAVSAASAASAASALSLCSWVCDAFPGRAQDQPVLPGLVAQPQVRRGALRRHLRHEVIDVGLRLPHRAPRARQPAGAVRPRMGRVPATFRARAGSRSRGVRGRAGQTGGRVRDLKILRGERVALVRVRRPVRVAPPRGVVLRRRHTLHAVGPRRESTFYLLLASLMHPRSVHTPTYAENGRRAQGPGPDRVLHAVLGALCHSSHTGKTRPCGTGTGVTGALVPAERLVAASGRRAHRQGHP
jgi:hypothetical protein